MRILPKKPEVTLATLKKKKNSHETLESAGYLSKEIRWVSQYTSTGIFGDDKMLIFWDMFEIFTMGILCRHLVHNFVLILDVFLGILF